jgi:hypothetical protein
MERLFSMGAELVHDGGVEVILATGIRHLCRNTFHDNRGFTPMQPHRGGARARFSCFADDALHVSLRVLKSSNHIFGSGW